MVLLTLLVKVVIRARLAFTAMVTVNTLAHLAPTLPMVGPAHVVHALLAATALLAVQICHLYAQLATTVLLILSLK